MRETIAQLCEENLRLRRELWVQKRDAEANEAIFRRFHGLELALLDAQSLPDLVDGMIDTTQQVLMLDEVTLILDDPHREIADLVASSGLSLPPPPKLQFARRPGGMVRKEKRLDLRVVRLDGRSGVELDVPILGRRGACRHPRESPVQRPWRRV